MILYTPPGEFRGMLKAICSCDFALPKQASSALPVSVCAQCILCRIFFLSFLPDCHKRLYGNRFTFCGCVLKLQGKFFQCQDLLHHRPAQAASVYSYNPARRCHRYRYDIFPLFNFFKGVSQYSRIPRIGPCPDRYPIVSFIIIFTRLIGLIHRQIYVIIEVHVITVSP